MVRSPNPLGHVEVVVHSLYHFSFDVDIQECDTLGLTFINSDLPGRFINMGQMQHNGSVQSRNDEYFLRRELFSYLTKCDIHPLKSVHEALYQNVFADNYKLSSSGSWSKIIMYFYHDDRFARRLPFIDVSAYISECQNIPILPVIDTLTVLRETHHYTKQTVSHFASYLRKCVQLIDQDRLLLRERLDLRFTPFKDILRFGFPPYDNDDVIRYFFPKPFTTIAAYDIYSAHFCFFHNKNNLFSFLFRQKHTCSVVQFYQGSNKIIDNLYGRVSAKLVISTTEGMAFALGLLYVYNAEHIPGCINVYDQHIAEHSVIPSGYIVEISMWLKCVYFRQFARADCYDKGDIEKTEQVELPSMYDWLPKLRICDKIIVSSVKGVYTFSKLLSHLVVEFSYSSSLCAEVKDTIIFYGYVFGRKIFLYNNDSSANLLMY